MRKLMIVALIAALLLTIPAAMAEGKLSVVCTDFPCYDFARQAAGDRAEVTMLLKPGTEAHSYDPSPADILAIGGADLFVYVGGESDAWVDNILDSFGDDAPARLRMMDRVNGLIEEDEDAHEHAHDGEPEYDEHIWTSPVNAMRMVEATAEALCAVDPAHAQGYTANAQAYGDAIGALDQEIRAIVEGAARREMVFADRFPFAYFAREYGIDTLAAFPSCTADTEPSAQTVMALIDRIARDRLPAVYVIEMSTQAVARTIAEETGVEILTMQSMQTVSQEDFESGATYVSIMEENIEALRKGLN